MVTLRRTVRFCINSAGAGGPDAAPSYNTYAASPSPVGLPRYFEIVAACRGEPDARTGYLVNIKDIDAAVRRAAIPIFEDACRADSAVDRSVAASRAGADPAHLLPRLHAEVAKLLPVPLAGLTFRLTPHHAFEGTTMAPPMPPAMPVVLLRTAFDLAASHRLHCPNLSDQENRDLFGKCNAPSGHGHNYRVEPCVALDLASLGSHPFTIQHLERVTDQTVISRFDHKHLNLDAPEFAAEGGVNPTVENIARVFFELLAPAIRDASPAATLRSITVWETDRTCATYPG
jgi:6-pyruvoyltetrahydropterin/6-carboxytetrahydropterin synthase